MTRVAAGGATTRQAGPGFSPCPASGAQRGIPDVRRVETRALPATISERADVFRVTGEALRDGKITALEAQRIHREVVEAHVALDELDEDVRASVTSDGRASSLAEASDA